MVLFLVAAGGPRYEKKNKEISDNKGKTAQKQEGPKKQKEPQGAAQEGAISREQMDSLQAELARTGVAMEAVQERYQIQKPEVMGGELYSKVMSALKRTKTAGAA